MLDVTERHIRPLKATYFLPGQINSRLCCGMMVTQPNTPKSIAICYVWLVERQATAYYNNHINQIFGGFYGYCRSTGSGKKIYFI